MRRGSHFRPFPQVLGFLIRPSSAVSRVLNHSDPLSNGVIIPTLQGYYGDSAHVRPGAPGTGLVSWKARNECYFPSLCEPNRQ